MSDPTRPARPGTGLTDDGRRLRVRTTYARRGGRLDDAQRAAWDAHADDWLIPESAVDAPGFSLASWFGREAPLVVEIGPGVGEATAALAAAHPETNILAIEVWRPGVADTLGRLDAAGVSNVRLLSVDAVWSLTNLVPEGGLAGLWTFFPDPWPKKKHHKRRLVNPSFARLAPWGRRQTGEAHMGMRRMLVVAGCTAAVVGVGAGSAFAGEITGSGKWMAARKGPR